jgi:precorrin-3B synthase
LINSGGTAPEFHRTSSLAVPVTLSVSDRLRRGGIIHRVPALPVTPRDRPDACPGALQVHAAADGSLARVRLPGGRLTGARLAALGSAAHDLGAGLLELTSRANIQVRALRPGTEPEFAARMAAAGLLPSATHERVRNIVASPLGDPALVSALDLALCARPGLAELPGRFLFAVDDGSADVLALGPDVAVIPDGPLLALLLAGADTGLRLSTASAVDTMLAAAEAFLAARDGAWRIAERPGLAAEIAERLPGDLPRIRPREFGPAPPPLVGEILQADGLVALGFLVPLGRLTSAQAADLAVHDALVVTPWRGLVVPGLPPGTSVPFVTDPASPWVGVTACTGRPGCAKSLADVQADATAALGPRATTTPVHWAGCERRCGRPKGLVVDVVATLGGYRVNDGPVLSGLDETAIAVSAAREGEA